MEFFNDELFIRLIGRRGLERLQGPTTADLSALVAAGAADRDGAALLRGLHRPGLRARRPQLRHLEEVRQQRHAAHSRPGVPVPRLTVSSSFWFLD